jgi:hypothetical protein
MIINLDIFHCQTSDIEKLASDLDGSTLFPKNE